jgi:hypothetical protein
LHTPHNHFHRLLLLLLLPLQRMEFFKSKGCAAIDPDK